MFPLLHNDKNTIHLIGPTSRVSVGSDGNKHFVLLTGATPGTTAIFEGTEKECEHFVTELYHSLMHMRGAETDHLARRAKGGFEEVQAEEGGQ